MSGLQPAVVGDEEVLSEADVQQVERQATKLDNLYHQALDLEVSNPADYQDAAALLELLNNVYAALESVLEPFRASAYEFYVQTRERKKSVLQPGEEAIDHLKDEMTAWKSRLEEQQRQQEEEFAQALESGEADLDDEPDPEDVPDIDGVHYRDNWSVEWDTDLYDSKEEALRALCAAIGRGDVSEDLVKLNRRSAASQARSQRSAFKVPGLKAVNNPILVDRR